MKILLPIILIIMFPVTANAGKDTPITIIAKEPVTMMDLGILRLNTILNRKQYPGLESATFSAVYHARRGTIDIKVSMPVAKASRAECNKLISKTKGIFLQPQGKKKVANIHLYFQHEGIDYKRRVNWDDMGKYVVITAIVLTGKNYRHSVYCQSDLMADKITY